jgi:hypothetical protein
MNATVGRGTEKGKRNGRQKKWDMKEAECDGSRM